MSDRSERDDPATMPADENEFLRYCGSLLLGLAADKAITRILTLLGRSHRADRAWLIRYNHDFTHLWNTHEWTRGETSKHITELQGVPVEIGAWLHEKLLKDEPVFIEETKRMPRRAKALQSEFTRQRIRSLLSVPVFYKGRLMLQLGYDSTTANADWSDADVDLLRQVGRLFALRLLANPDPPSFQPDDEVQDSAPIHLQESAVHRRFPLNQITHITADGDYSHMHFLNSHSVSDTHNLRYWESALSPRRFVRISRSTIVNLNCVNSLDRRSGNWKLELQNVPKAIPVGRNYRSELRVRLEY